MYSSRDVDGGSDSSDDGSEFNYSDFIESGDDDNGVSSSSSDSDSDISFTSADSSSSPSSSALPSVEDAYTDSNAYSST